MSTPNESIGRRAGVLLRRAWARPGAVSSRRFALAILTLGSVVLCAVRAARPLNFVPGLVVAAVVLLPNLLVPRFRLWVWSASVLFAFAVTYAAQFSPLTNYGYFGCELYRSADYLYSSYLPHENPKPLIVRWFIAALASGVLLRFLDRGPSGRLSDASGLVLAGGLWLAGVGLVARHDDIFRLPYEAKCSCSDSTLAFGEMVCPDLVLACVNAPHWQEDNPRCTPVISPVALAGATAAQGLLPAGLVIAALGLAARRRRAVTEAGAVARSAGFVPTFKHVAAAFLVLPPFLVGLSWNMPAWVDAWLYGFLYRDFVMWMIKQGWHLH